MKKILGLDIGVNSIGWAYVHEPDNEMEQYKIIQLGSRIIPLNPDESDEFSKGNAISKNAARRIKRGIRRGFHRYKMRKWKLNKLFADLNMMPGKGLFSLNSLELYGLRSKAAGEKISLQELARVMYHLNQKRGYKSNRKANAEELSADIESEKEDAPQKKKGYLDRIYDREKILKQDKLTIGQFFYKQLLGNPFYRIKENIFMRKSYEEEFTRIWNKQKEFYPEILTDQHYHIFFHEIIYYQRPLRSQKGLVGECRFECYHLKNKAGELIKDEKGQPITKKPKVIPKSSPLFQLAKVWQDINHIKIKDKTGKEITISIEQKQTLFAFLNCNEKISVTSLKKMLGLTPADQYYINLTKDSLEGNRTIAAIQKALRNERQDALRFDLSIELKNIPILESGEVIQIPVIQSSYQQESLYRLWHLLYSIEDPDLLIATLMRTNGFAFTKEQAEALTKIDFSKAGYGAISAKAYCKILPQLTSGCVYSEACHNAGYRHSDYLTQSENEVRILLDKLKLYPKNSLRNPVVEKIINQVINLLNAILQSEELGRPDEIRVELARELKQNKEERNNTYSRNNKDDARHKKIRDRLLSELGISASRRDIERVKLWEEFGQVSPYEPGKAISLKELFYGDYEIEHIIPQSRLFNDSFSNKTICRKKFNTDKDNATAYDYIQSLGDQRFHEYTEFVKKNFYKKDGINRSKLNFLLMSGDQIPQDFISRQLRETAYISREIKNLLSQVCRNVFSTSGAVTGYLRDRWGMNHVLQTLNFEKYKSAGLTENISVTREDGSIHEKEVIQKEVWSKRDDHRHHAIDALVIALTKQGFINKLNSLNQYYKNQKELKQSDRKFELPWKSFVSDAIKATDQVLISFKSGKKVATKNTNLIKSGSKVIREIETLTPRGSLSEESIYGKIKQYNPDGTFNEVYVIKYKLGVGTGMLFSGNETVTAKGKDQLRNVLDSIVDKAIRSVIEKRLQHFNNNPKEAFRNLADNPVWLNEPKGIAIHSVRCFKGGSKVRALHTNEKNVPVDFVMPANNHHIALYKDHNGNVHGNTVSFWDAVERKKIGLSVIVKHPTEIWDKILNGTLNCSEEIKNNLPPDRSEFLISIQQNEMFIHGLSLEELNDALQNNNNALISKHLYRIQNIASRQYILRHHLETRDLRDKTSRELKKMVQLSSASFSSIKVKINNLGRIVKIGE
jgi:CRISPR-associated endonuclease Csn1